MAKESLPSCRGFVMEIARQVEAFAARIEEQGYVRITGEVVEVTADFDTPTVYIVQVFKLNATRPPVSR